QLPGATGGSPKARRRRKPDQESALTLAELERWFLRQIVGKYHNTAHRGLRGGTPNGAWAANPAPTLPGGPIRKFRIAFLPAVTRTLRRDGIVLKHIRYWHPIFAQWLGRRKTLLLHFDPRDLSRLFVLENDDYIEVRYADLRQPSVSLWEIDAAIRHLREAGRRTIVPGLIVQTVEEQRQLIREAQSKTRRARRRVAPGGTANAIDPLTPDEPTEPIINWEKPARANDGEVW
ncbi:MAG: Mu transposase C-terminal domain-containing protein, partial [Burkholderiaceae bacterium]